MKRILFLAIFIGLLSLAKGQENAWIRINQLGYLPESKKVAVWVSKGNEKIKEFEIIDSQSNKTVFKGKAGKGFGHYGPFASGYRLDFSGWTQSGTYYVRVENIKSPVFRINEEVYKGTADFALRYMRQQRTLFNPFLQDSCHTHDGFTLYAQSVGLPDSTHVDVGGGWHDASDYLQYATTSANATYHLLAAYRDFPDVFSDEKQANGLDGSNGLADVLDEAKWGLDWLLKMHPKPNIMFNQIADDRDHTKLRMPGEDPYYGRGFERPVYFIDGKPQQRGKFLNNTTGTSSTAAKFVSAFALGHHLFDAVDRKYSTQLRSKAQTAYAYSYIKPGVTQTVSVKSPYIYAEDNWVDDMELAEIEMYSLFGDKKHVDAALSYAAQEKITPWMIRDTANHYQYYPFINLGHYELAKKLQGDDRAKVLSYYKAGIDAVWERAQQNVFFRGVPFIWCSNNLTTSFAIQCMWYRTVSGDDSYDELEQANIDWLFGVNPWGTSMVYGLPAWGDTPVDPHSAFTHLHQYPIDGGLVDGPVYAATYNSLIGIKLLEEDEYAEFQSDLVVYHDDFGDYSTNEPTMDGTASLIYLLSAQESKSQSLKIKDKYGAIVRGDTSKKQISLVFTGHEFRDGIATVEKALNKNGVKGSFFVTGEFVEKNTKTLRRLFKNGNYIGPHSDAHLLYSPWENRDSLLLNEVDFQKDLQRNVDRLTKIGVTQIDKFIPPYEWYNDKIVDWANRLGIQTYNFTPGIRTVADYTYPEMQSRYVTTEAIINQLYALEAQKGLNGNIILIHLGTDKRRKDKLYNLLDELIRELKLKNYNFVLLEKL
ncbi:cellulase [Sphingobacterium olei]|uniref:Cellulase n=1 Tax=Sphingobacterium olei TaxID=2571155 RepID=A0A4U0P3M5_9SPHI|nr:glycoside hydrolase family 9 protein [Sphingobacterium olei]TJZ61971.1 cellulase [Sphingobacterium olei]